MYHIDNGTGIPNAPAIPPVKSTTKLYFTEGGNGVSPSVPGGEWFNAVTDELLQVLIDAGITPDKFDHTQLSQAIQSRIESAANQVLEDSQPLDPTLTALAALTGAADKLPYFNGPDSAVLTAFTALARQLLACADAAAMRTVLDAEQKDAIKNATYIGKTKTDAFSSPLSSIEDWENLAAGSLGFVLKESPGSPDGWCNIFKLGFDDGTDGCSYLAISCDPVFTEGVKFFIGQSSDGEFPAWIEVSLFGHGHTAEQVGAVAINGSTPMTGPLQFNTNEKIGHVGSSGFSMDATKWGFVTADSEVYLCCNAYWDGEWRKHNVDVKSFIIGSTTSLGPIVYSSESGDENPLENHEHIQTDTFSTIDHSAMVSDVVYTNTTDKPMLINISGYGNGTDYSFGLSLYINNTLASQMEINSIDNAGRNGRNLLNVTAVCPAGGTYKFTNWNFVASVWSRYS